MDNKGPQVISTSQASNPYKKKWFNPRLIFLPLIVIITIEVVLGLKTILTPIPKANVQESQPVSGAKILLITPTTVYKVGDNIPIKVRLSTGGHNTIGTDAILRFNPKFLQASQSAIIKGDIYNDYPQIQVDNQGGIIRISGIATNTIKGFNGIGELAIVNFKAKLKGSSQLTLDFEKGATNKSNVIDPDLSQNILEKVSNIEVFINE